jgi:anti-anti-sigma regulatory factor
VVVDVSAVRRMITAAFDQLVTMKRFLHVRGTSMRTEGLQGPPQGLCEILGLKGLLLNSVATNVSSCP